MCSSVKTPCVNSKWIHVLCYWTCRFWSLWSKVIPFHLAKITATSYMWFSGYVIAIKKKKKSPFIQWLYREALHGKAFRRCTLQVQPWGRPWTAQERPQYTSSYKNKQTKTTNNRVVSCNSNKCQHISEMLCLCLNKAEVFHSYLSTDSESETKGCFLTQIKVSTVRLTADMFSTDYQTFLSLYIRVWIHSHCVTFSIITGRANIDAHFTGEE